MDINIYDLKLREIDRKIAEYNNTGWGKAYTRCSNQTSSSIFFGGAIGASAYIDGINFKCTEASQRYANTVGKLEQDRKNLVLEMQKEQQYLKDQYILQQQQATEFSRQAALEAAQKVEQAKNISEQELQKAKQELEKANQELARAKAAQSLAKSVDVGNLEAGRIMMGINTVNKYKLPLLIGGGVIGLGILSFVAYKIFKKK